MIGGTAGNAGECTAFTPSTSNTPDAGLELRTRGPVVVEASTEPVAVGARVLGDSFVPLGTVAPGSERAVDLPATAAGPWHLQLASTGAFRACVTR